MKTQAILTFILMLSTVKLLSATYYVSASDVNADDNNSGTSIAAPWKTVGRVNLASLVIGDVVKFKCGDVWQNTDNEFLVQTLNVTSGVTYSSYGNGDLPKLDFSRRITSWTQYSGNIYVADITSSGIETVDQVYVDGVRLMLAHEPNDGFFYVDENSTDNVSFLDNDLSSSLLDIVGAEVQLRSEDWALEGIDIGAFDTYSKIITLTNSTKGNITQNDRYILSNKLWMLDSAGEWFYDTVTKKLYIWLVDSSNPSNHTIEVPAYDNAIYADGKSDFSINSLEICKTKTDGIYIENSTMFSIHNNNISEAGKYGIMKYLGDNSYSTISNNTIANCILGGIQIKGCYAANQNFNILNNNISNIFTRFPERRMNDYEWAIGAGIFIWKGSRVNPHNTNCTVSKNSISNCGYSGIIFTASNNKAEYNIIKNCCTILKDGAGIYMSQVGNTIDHNIIEHSGLNGDLNTHGIYMDDESQYATITHNTIIDAGSGVLVHNSENNTIMYNTIFNSRSKAIYFSENMGYEGSIRYNTVSNNILYSSINKDGSCISELGMYNNIDFAVFANNYYAYIASGHPFIRKHYPYYPNDNQTYELEMFRNLNEWQLAVSDTDSVEQNDYFTIFPIYDPGEVSRVIVNPFSSTVSIPADDSYTYFDIYGNKITFPVSLDAYDSKILVRMRDWSPRMSLLHYTFDQITNNTVENQAVSGGIATLYSMNEDNLNLGVVGNALSFSGNGDYVDCGDISELELDGNLTISFWIKPDDVYANSSVIGTSYGAEFLLRTFSSGALGYYHGTATASGYHYGGYILNPGILQNNLWQHVAIIRDTGTRTIKGYHNGVLIRTLCYTENTNIFPSVGNYPLKIGSGYAGNFAGQIDEVRIYDYPLSDNEISHLINVNIQEKIIVKFDEGIGSFAGDISGNGKHGSLNGNATWTSQGKSGGSIEFDGNGDYVDCGDISGLELDGDLTISFWIKPNNTLINYSIIGTHYLAEFALRTFTNANGVAIGYYHGNGTTYDGGWILDPGVLLANQWQHVVITRDSTTHTVKGYYNGELNKVRSYETNALPSIGTYPLKIGSGYAGDFAGQIDEVRIYSRVLNATEVKHLSAL